MLGVSSEFDSIPDQAKPGTQSPKWATYWQNCAKSCIGQTGRVLEEFWICHDLGTICPKNPLCELIVKLDRLESRLPLVIRRSLTVRKLGPVALLVLILVANCFAAPAAVRSAVIPEPGLLALLGGGLVGLAALIRRHLSD
jgi:hypothetical protein